MKIGLVGYQGSGKSTLFQWLTTVAPDPSVAHATQTAMAEVPDPRLGALCEIFHPKKVTHAALEIVDTPGLNRTHQGSAARLALVREAGCLVLVVAAFDDSDPLADLRGFEEDLLLTDLELVTGRIARLQESLKKPRPNRDQMQAELAAIEPLVGLLEAGKPLHEVELTDEQVRVTRSFQLLTDKRRLAIVNLADDQQQWEPLAQDVDLPMPVVAAALRLEQELSQMEASERQEFRREMGLASFDRDGLLRTLMEASGQMLFFTVGPKEVRSWMIDQGATAVEAAGTIHTDMARGFIRAEVIRCDDLLRLGSEREAKAQGLVRQEPKDYVIQDGDTLNMRFSV